MDNPEEIWNLLHDGGIANVWGVVPGDLTLRVEIDYLTQIMNPPCDAIELTLVGCKTFEFLNWNDDRRTTDVDVLAELEILSAINTSTGVHVICSGGQFDIQYGGIRIARTDGTPAAVEEIDAIATAYWDAFGSKRGG